MMLTSLCPWLCCPACCTGFCWVKEYHGSNKILVHSLLLSVQWPCSLSSESYSYLWRFIFSYFSELLRSQNPQQQQAVNGFYIPWKLSERSCYLDHSECAVASCKTCTTQENLSTNGLVNWEDVWHSAFFLSLLNPDGTYRDLRECDKVNFQWQEGLQGARGSWQKAVIFVD